MRQTNQVCVAMPPAKSWILFAEASRGVLTLDQMGNSHLGFYNCVVSDLSFNGAQWTETCC